MQQRRAWCRACGTQRSYRVGWLVVTPDVARALQDRAGGKITVQKAPQDGRVLVRLRMRHLACAGCGEVGMLVAGNPPRFAATLAELGGAN
jgi:hypothetical protein